MKFNFQVIHTLDDILPAIEGCSDFIIADKEDYLVVNYVVTTNDTFPPVVMHTDPAGMFTWQDINAALRRDCRGLIFNAGDKKIIRRPYHKFFNLGEKEEVLPNNIDFNKPHIIMDKLDGSMIVPFFLHDRVRWGTKMGITDVSLQAEEFVKKNPVYKNVAEYFIQNGYSPIFEWCSPNNRIVLHYQNDQLIMTAARDIITGEYVRDSFLKDYCMTKDIPFCPVFDGISVQDVDSFVSKTRNETDKEGYVVRFKDTGHMIKVKSDWYVNLHKVKESVNSERSLLSLWFDGAVDDALAVLDKETKDRIDFFILHVSQEIQVFSKIVWSRFCLAQINGTRKDFALGEAKTCGTIERALIFKLWDMDNEEDVLHDSVVMPLVMATIKKSLTNNTNYEKMKKEVYPNLEY